MSIPLCITRSDYKEKAKEILSKIEKMQDEEKIEFLADTLYLFWAKAILYGREPDGHTGYGR